MSATYERLVKYLRETAVLSSCGSLLGWDEQALLPPEGAEFRAEQASLIAGMVHDRVVDSRVQEWLQELESSQISRDPDSVERATIREARRDYDRATKIPKRLVEELTQTATLAQQAWIGARKRSKFAEFQPWLEKIVRLKREEAAAVGWGNGVPYDALLDEYEPGATSVEVKRLFEPLRKATVELLGQIKTTGDETILTRTYPVEQQRTFSRFVAERVGFRFPAGRLDVSTHPFCSGIGPGDCRLTTRYDPHHFPGAFFGTLHEVGHGMYEQNLKREAFGTALGQSVSLGIHESQSRMWENFVGRSKSFWEHFFVPAQAVFPEALGTVSLEDFYRAINRVSASYIRVEADEVTYNLHIMLRFELETALLNGDLKPADVPGAWNEAFQRDFGMTPPDDARGCLQDIHWSGGGIGYFPTYTLGNMYAAQLFEAADRTIGPLHAQFARGEFQPLRDWLISKIHQRGKQYHPRRLAEIVTGEPLSPEPLIRHLKQKFLA